MPTLQFSNGKTVQFSAMPTQADIDQLGQQMGIHTPAPAHSSPFAPGGDQFTQPTPQGATKMQYAPGSGTSTGSQFMGSLGTGVKQTAQSLVKPVVSGAKEVGNDTSQAFQGGVNQIKQGANDINQGGNPFEATLKMGSGAVGSAFSPLAAPMKPVSNAVNYAADKISDNPTVQKFANSKAGQVTSRVAEDVGNFANIAQGVGGFMGAPEIKGKLETGLNTTAEAAKPGLNAVKNDIVGAGQKIASTGQKVLDTVHNAGEPNFSDMALKDATPTYNKKLIGEAPIKNIDGTLTPRVSEGGMMKGRVVNPTLLETQAAGELAKVKGYPINGTALEKYQSVQPEITTRAKGLITSLKNEKILRPPQQIAKVVSNAINKVPEESLLLQKSDPLIQNYMRVTKNAINQTDGTLAGELKVKQLLDTAYKNARGKMAFGSDKISALDDIHTAARDALTQDLINKAKNTDVKASLKSQWDLLRASDVLRNKAEAEAGSSIGRFAQKHPILSKSAKAAGRAVGIGAGVHVIP